MVKLAGILSEISLGVARGRSGCLGRGTGGTSDEEYFDNGAAIPREVFDPAGEEGRPGQILLAPGRPESETQPTMSVHKSLSPRNRLSRSRNVLKRHERLEVLTQEGRWEKGQSVYGLPKTKNPQQAKK